MAAFQAELLLHAADWVRPGGSLVYAVCSLEPAEGEERITAIVAERTDYRLAEQRRVLPGELEEQGGMDGFFIARFANRG